MNQVIVIRYGELFLKGNNRGFFERALCNDIRRKLKGIRCLFLQRRGRYIVESYALEDEQRIISRLLNVFGIQSLSIARRCAAQIDVIVDAALNAMKSKSGTFKVVSHRADKTFTLNSVQLSTMLGGKILENNNALSVDLHSPDHVLNVDIREDKTAFVFCDKINGIGGMPLNSSGKGMVLLSGGLDSPVAAFVMAKRGISLQALHFHSYPYTNEKARQKVRDLAKKLTEYVDRLTLHEICLTEIQEAIHKNCTDEYMITLLRVVMMHIGAKMARLRGCMCLINGESLGQVASQTLESIHVTDSVAEIPVFRPLIGMDKQEIIDRAKQIGTYDISILPHEDCCTVFLPRHPVTKPSKYSMEKELKKLVGLDEMIDRAINACERTQLTHLCLT